MSFLESCVDNPATLSKGLLWAIRKGSRVNPRVNDLLERAKKNGKNADILEIDGFDQLMFSVYQMQNYHNEIIDGQGRMLQERRDVCLSGQPVDSFVKLNGYQAEGCPLCIVFETDITSWAELRTIIGESDVLAALYNKHIYAFSSKEKLETVFQKHILSPITREEDPDRIINKYNSIYIGLIYQLIKRTLLSKGMLSFAKNKVYNPNSCKEDGGYRVFDALETAVSFINGTLFLNLLPTVHVRSSKGDILEREAYQTQVNRIVSRIYNQQYNENLRLWEKLLHTSGRIRFENDGFSVSFILPAISVGSNNRDPKRATLPSCRYDEPLMCFSDTNKAKRSVNQLIRHDIWQNKKTLFGDFVIQGIFR